MHSIGDVVLHDIPELFARIDLRRIEPQVYDSHPLGQPCIAVPKMESSLVENDDVDGFGVYLGEVAEATRIPPRFAPGR